MVKTDFSNRKDCFGFLHFPMFKEDLSGRKEIDILLFDRELGAVVIEVKGFKIDEITGISGHTWLLENIYTSSAEPYNQAEQQLYMLCDEMEKNPLFYKTFSKRAYVALPYITRKQWEEKGFNKLYTPPILFKDDLDEGNLADKLKQFAVFQSRTSINDYTWSKIKHYFYINESRKQVDMEETNDFSHLHVFEKIQHWEEEKYNIAESLKEGKKVYVFSPFPIPRLSIKELYLDRYIEEFQFQLFQSTEWEYKGGKKLLVDGENNRFIKNVLVPNFPEFNYGQFIAIHTPSNRNLMIAAGAGTGKTYVMIDRIFYLLEKEDVALKDIVMITFTNASTNEMKERLQKKLLSMFHLTKKTKYLYYAEEVKDMQISTIHSFSKSILSQLAHELGYGRNFKVTGFKNKKKEIIERLTDEFFKMNPIKDILSAEIKHYELVELMETFWAEMEKKGLTDDEIKNQLEWGLVVPERHQIFNELFRYVFHRCEEELEQEKKSENAIDLNDMVRKLKLFKGGEKLDQLQKNKYIFIDEFQDSDNTQIELLANLHNHLNYKLFVVGDIKQSIYRFRGGDYTAFERLMEKVPSGFQKVNLKHNYRTSSSLLKKLDKIFSVWGKDSGNSEASGSLLPYTVEDRLISSESSSLREQEFICPKVNKEDLKKETIFHIRKSFELIKLHPSKKDKDKIALIVRTNKDAEKVRNWCEQEGIKTIQSLNGTFFKSDAVKHFKMLLDALLFPNEPKFVLNLLQSPYFGYSIPAKSIVPFMGDKKRIVQYLKEWGGNKFSTYLDDLRKLPVMAVIQKVISEEGLLHNIAPYYENKLGGSGHIDVYVKQYEKNLYHLMNMIQQQFSPMNATLWTLYEWLTLQIRVNRDENEPEIETPEDAVDCQ